MFCIAFGLSMDYEVFLLSRIKEEYDLDRDNEHAVAVGLQKTGRIVTAAALLLTIVFVGIATSEVSIVKLFGVGLSLAVLVDAFLIRATLVPAFMRLAGRSNWWSPALAAPLAPPLRDLGERADRDPRPRVRSHRSERPEASEPAPVTWRETSGGEWQVDNPVVNFNDLTDDP